MHINYWNEIHKNNIGRIGLILLALVVITAVAAPVLSIHNPVEQSAESFLPPSDEHLLGTNDVGQDIFARLVTGTRVSLIIAVGAALLTTFISAAIGASAGYVGGIYDKVAMRIVDVVLIIPPMVFIIIVAAYVQPGTVHLILLLSLLGWPGGARVVRAQTMTLKEKMHVLAAKTYGAGTFYIIRRHIIPELGPILIANFINGARRAVFMEAGLSYLGVTDPMSISWGKMLYHSLKYIYLDVWQWWLIPVGISLSITIMSFTFIGYALEEALNPRLRRGKHALHKKPIC